MKPSHPILLFRHFPTQDDQANRYTPFLSEADPLPVLPNRLGELCDQIRHFASRTAIKKIYCADNKRSLLTAQSFLNAGTFQIIPSPDLRNIHCPQWEGLTEKDAQSKYPDLYTSWYTHPLSTHFPGGESISDVSARIENLLTSTDEPILFVTHTTPIQVIVCNYLGLSLDLVWRFKPEHFAFTVLRDGVLFAFNTTELDLITLHL
jgi:broad specificity phosphatase PhoE